MGIVSAAKSKLTAAIANSVVVTTLRSDTFRVFSVLGAVMFVLVLGAGGVLSGASLLLISLITLDTVGAAIASFVLSFSSAAVVGSYLWLTG